MTLKTRHNSQQTSYDSSTSSERDCRANLLRKQYADIIPVRVSQRVTNLFYTGHCCNTDEVMSEPSFYCRVIITSDETLNL